MIVLFFFISALVPARLYAQVDTSKINPLRIGIFAPLYLDSVFSNNTFKYKQSLPKFIVPAVDFVRGAQLALDSLQAGNDIIDATIYDTRSYSSPVQYLIQNKKLDSLQLIIGSVKDAEYRQLAEFAKQKNIPFISATYPNDAGVIQNPYLAIMNPTLKSHCEAIYSYILQKHGTEKIYLCRQKGTQEDMVTSYFKQINEKEGKPLLNIETINFDNNLAAAYLKTKLDSNQNSVLISASLDETFAVNIVKACFDLHIAYTITLIGMPTWDGFATVTKNEDLLDFPVYYTTSYFNNKTDDFSKSVIESYRKKYKTYPGDMVYKGFESVYLFTKILAKNPGNFMSHINDKNVTVFCDYNFRPVYLKKENLSAGQTGSSPDYFENKHLYFIKMVNGIASKAW